MNTMKKTKIICTLGPSSNTKKMITEMAEAGMDIARINMSHADKKTFLETTKTIREANKSLMFPISILLDTQGTDLRLERLDDPIGVDVGDDFELRHEGKPNTKHKGASINMNIFGHVKKGTKIFIDDGTIELEVKKSHRNWALCKVCTSGVIKSRKSVNVPNLEMKMSGISDKDYDEIKFAMKHGIDIITLSFIRHKEEVMRIRKLADRMKCNVMIISKIEDATGVKNIDEIIEASDGVMVARGDLGTEIPIEDVPLVQKSIIEKCLEKGKQVAVATHMMESMIDNPTPTRAEVSDIASAVSQKTDMIMLSAETSVGKYPIRCVKTMAKICERMEREEKFILPIRGKEKRTLKEEITISASMLARNLGAKAIVVFTKTGQLARFTSKQRPTTPIFAFTEHENVRRLLTLPRGVYAYPLKLEERSHVNTINAMKRLKEDGFLKKKDMVIIISDIFKGHKKSQIIWVRKVQ